MFVLDLILILDIKPGDHSAPLHEALVLKHNAHFVKATRVGSRDMGMLEKNQNSVINNYMH